MARNENEITVFLGGPICYAMEDNGIFNPDLRSNFESLVSSMEAAGFTVFSSHRCEGYGEMDVSNQSRAVTLRDFNWLARCTVFVAYLPVHNEKLLRTDGTCVELGWASAKGKPIILIQDTDVSASHLIEGLGAVANVSVLPVQETLRRTQALINEIRRVAK